MWPSLQPTLLSYVDAAASLIGVTVVYLFMSRKRVKRSYPPGPPADPLIGHARIFPQTHPQKTFAEWSKRLGDIIYVHVLGKPIVIVNSLEIARDLLEKRGANYSDRPQAALYHMLDFWRPVFNLPYGDRWRKLRRLISQSFTPEAMKNFHPLIHDEVVAFLKRFDGHPEDFSHNVHMLLSSIVVNVTYGHEVTSDDDRYVSAVESFLKVIASFPNPGAMAVDFFPFLKYAPAWFPGAAFMSVVPETKATVREMYDTFYDNVKRDRISGHGKPSLMANWQEDYENSAVIDEDYVEDLKATGLAVCSAGVETSVSSLLTFFLVMVLNPDAAHRAQRELDQFVLEEGRLPTFADRENLPYVECVLKETYRIGSNGPLSVPRLSYEDDVYNGMYIPSGTIVMPNIWSMMRNENVYPDAETFSPERFMNMVKITNAKKGKERLDESNDGAIERGAHIDDSDPSNIVFGFGRRICPGRYLADTSLWLAMALTLALFDILPAIDPNTGEEVLPKVEFTSGITIQPKPFKCRVVPRSDRHLALLKELHGAY